MARRVRVESIGVQTMQAIKNTLPATGTTTPGNGRLPRTDWSWQKSSGRGVALICA